VSYVAGFRHDVFISYAHYDNEADSQDVRWVSRFQIDLTRALRQRLGTNPDIFFDNRNLQAGHEIDSLMDNARDAAVFLAVVSPSYVQRDWTIKELEAFGDGPGEVRRVIAVELLPVKEAEYPPRLARVMRTSFWWSDETSENIPLKLTPKSGSDNYERRLQVLAHQMEELLRGLRDTRAERAAARPEAAPLPAPVSDQTALTGKVVLVAQVTNDLYDEREQVIAYLKQFGAKILPEQEYLQGGPDFAREFKADIERADCFAQLLGPFRSSRPQDLRCEPGGEPTSYAQFQYDCAKQAGKPILQWRRPNLDTASVTHWDARLLDGPEVLAMGLQDFMKEIKKTIERGAQKAVEPEPQASRDNLVVFINADRDDLDVARDLMAEFGRNACRAWLPAAVSSARDKLEDLKSKIKIADALLFVYGKAPQIWVHKQLMKYNQIEKSSNAKRAQRRIVALYITPPADKPDIDLAWPDLREFDCRLKFTLTPVQQIIAELRR